MTRIIWDRHSFLRLNMHVMTMVSLINCYTVDKVILKAYDTSVSHCLCKVELLSILHDSILLETFCKYYKR
jgi:hypothetical protein